MARQNNSPQIGQVTRTASTQRFALSERFYDPHMDVPLHSHKKSYIIITVSGRYVSMFDTRIEEYNPWTVTYVSAGVLHTSRYPVSGARVLYVELPSDSLGKIREISSAQLSRCSVQGGAAAWTARQLYNEFTTFDDLSPMLIDGYVMQLVAHVVRHSSTRRRPLPVWLGHADELIRRRFREPLALNDIATSVQVHPGHLAREYRRYYSCTIGEQIRRLRIEYACEQLADTDRDLCDIALAAGFSDQSHFSVSFKQHTGSVPSKYRKSAKQCFFREKMLAGSKTPASSVPYL